MLYKNKHNFDLQKISEILKENGIEHNIIENKIAVDYKGVQSQISVAENGINFQTAVPLIIRGILWVIGAFLCIWFMMFILEERDRGTVGFVSVVAGTFFQMFGPAVHKILSPNVLKQKAHLMGLILNYKEPK